MFKRQFVFNYNSFLSRCAVMIVVLFNVNANAQTTDTLPEIKLAAIKYPDVTTSPVPVQQLNKEALSHLNSLSVAEAVKYFSGVLVKDYGGVGGLKTVSVRSLGANHTGVMYDGIMMSDVQGGQIDLGKLSLDNIESISLYNSQPATILLPARSFASASVLQLKIAVPVFDVNKKWKIKTAVKAGSFGFASAAANIQYQFSRHFYNTLSAGWQRADGAYKFKPYEIDSPVQRRINSDINALRLEYDAGYKINDSSILKLKAYYYNSERGLPGVVVLYNGKSDERLTDQNFFAQASWQHTFNVKSRLLLNGRYAYNYNFYLDPGYPSTAGKLENKFVQKEYYLSAAYSYQLSPVFSAAYATDYSIDKLTRTDDFIPAGFPFPTRKTLLNNISMQANFANLELQGNLLHTYLKDEVKRGDAGRNIDALSPALALSYQPSSELPLRFRAFYKRIFRAPTFNDLYYTNIGNTDLHPEHASQYNIGLTYKHTRNNFITSAIFTADAYYNKVTNKIVAIPSQNLFQWTMLNIGTVDIKGIDVAAQLYFKEFNSINLSARLAYTFQKALDITDKNSELYKKQIPYTPEHSGSISVNAVYKKLDISYNVLLSGYRYRLGVQVPINLVKEWATQDISISYDVHSQQKNKYKFVLELNNIFNKQYEVIKYYPMPGFNYRLGMIAEF